MSIFDAIEDNDFVVFKALVAEQHSARDKRQRTPLHKVSSIEMACMLIQYGADVHAVDNRGCTPLHYAQCPEIVVALVNAGADVRAMNNRNLTPLAVCFRAPVIKRLLLYDADVNVSDLDGEYLLHKVNDDVELCTELIRLGARVNVANCIGVTPLHRCQSLACVKLLVEAGANPNFQGLLGWTPLFLKNSEATKYLIEHGADLNANHDGMSALDCARHFKLRETATTLVLEGCNVGKYPVYIFLHFITLLD